MKVYAFIGSSGTGKSHRATWVAREKEADYIIDDGLLIEGNRIVAGCSAKREKTRIASIKRALFTDEKHTNEVKKVINENRARGILIIGTSDGMVEKIAKRLGLKKVDEKIYINEVASEYEIKQAVSTRKEQGKHVIPVPTFEIKKDFSGYFLDPLQIFKRKGKGSYQLIGEKSVVRPTFSYLGNYTISDYTIYQLIEHAVININGVYRISRFRAENQPDGIYIEIDLVLIYGYIIRPLLNEVKNRIKNEVEKLTALNIKVMKLTAKTLVIDQNYKNNLGVVKK
ncbi:MAG: hypothetical protein ABF289_17200 [Clostridiales bacterium]